MSEVLGKDKSDIPELGEAVKSATPNIENPNMIIIDEAGDMTPSMFDHVLDVAAPFEFICTHRVYDVSAHAHHYHVDPVGEYGDLDFVGHKVLINERERLCDKFEIVDGKVIITVYCRADD